MKAVTVEQMRELDRRTIEEFGTPGETLMDRAGWGVAEVIREHAADAALDNLSVLMVAGKGNNGGDVYVAADYLKNLGFEVEVLMTHDRDAIKGDALKHFELMEKSGIETRSLPNEDDWDEMEVSFKPGIVLDGVLGTGCRGAAEGVAASAIAFINTFIDQAWIVSVDIPSGLNAETGEADGPTVQADLTITMGLPKFCLLKPAAIEYVGELRVVDIGIPEDYVAVIKNKDAMDFICDATVRALLPRRKRNSHKGTYGHVLVIGGSRGLSGAVIMSAQAALRAGAGLVTVLTPYGVLPLVAAACPEIMVQGARENNVGVLDASLWDEWRTRSDSFDAVLVGPGISRHDEILTLVRRILRDCAVPMVLDADAISVLNAQPHWIEKAECDVVITPHPGELAGLFGQDVAEVQANREGMAVAAAKYTNSTVVLKGAGTVVARQGSPTAINLNGNPGMATGGTGDVLSGMLAALIGQGFHPYDAARTAVFIHGRAGDLAALNGSQAGMIAGDLIQEIPRAFRRVSVR